MKIAVTVLSALIALASVNGQNAVPDFGEGPLHDDMQFFVNMVPISDIEQIILKYSIQDPEFRHALNYILSDEFKLLVVDIEHSPQVLYFLSYLEYNGIYAYDMVNKVNSILGIDEMLPATSAIKNKYEPVTGGLAGLFKEVKELISYDQFIHGYAYKMKTSPAFHAFVNELKSDNFQGIVDFLYAHQTFLNVRSFMVAAGVNFKLLEDIMFTVLGTNFPDFTMSVARDEALSKDIAEFLNVAITDEIQQIVSAYANEDPQVKRGLKYADSKEFEVSVRKVEATKEFRAFTRYLKEAGVEMRQTNSLLPEFGLEQLALQINEKYESIISRKAPQPPGFSGMVSHIRIALPKKQLRDLFNLKMKNSPAFIKFVRYVRAPEFEKLATALYVNPRVLEMRVKAKAGGLDLQAFDDLAFAIYRFIKQ